MELGIEGLEVLAAMAAPAVLLLGNAMLILSTNQRIQTILDRVRETELTIAGQDAAPEISDLSLLNDLLVVHARRAKYAHRGLLCFYTSAALFMLMVVLIGITGAGIVQAGGTAMVAAFGGCLLFALGTAFLMTETWLGIDALDRRFANVMELCRQLTRQRSEPS